MSLRPRKFALFGLGAGLAAASGHLAPAQMHHVDAPERVTRAIGIYEWTGDLAKPTAARFVPVSLFISGHFEDAGLYLARPVPFALEPGNVYAIEHTGEPEGLLDIDFAKRIVTSKALADDNPVGAWYAFGKFTPQSAPHLAPLHASHNLPTLTATAGPNTPAGTKVSSPAADDDGRPHMSRRDSSTTQPAPQPSSSGSAPSSTDSGSTKSADTSKPSTSSTDSSDDTDRPTLRRRDPAQDAARRHEYGKKGDQSSVIAAGPALGDDPDRPRLGHGKVDDAGTPELNGLPADMHQAVAVSDATHRDDHPFARDWDDAAERNLILNAMAALAKPRVASYLTANNLVPSAAPLNLSAATGEATSPAPSAPPSTTETAGPPHLQRGVPKQYQSPAPSTSRSTANQAAAPPKSTSTASTTAHHTAHAISKSNPDRGAPLMLQQETVSGFTLSYGGLPTFVFTAAASAAPARPATADAAIPSNVTVYVTVVAQRLASGDLQVALASVTDSQHLDRTPRLRLIDAVDPDDSHRASLLFELRGSTSRQFAFYRLTSAHAEQTFTTASIE